MALLIEFNGFRPRIAASAFVAPNAVLLGNVELGEDVSVWFGAVLRADFAPIRIGAGSNVQDNVVVHSETGGGTILEERVTVGHAAILHDCWIGREALIGMGAVLLSGSRIGAGSMVGAASLVRQKFEVPPGTLAVGNPAVIKGPLMGSAADWVGLGADSYIELTAAYRSSHRILR